MSTNPIGASIPAVATNAGFTTAAVALLSIVAARLLKALPLVSSSVSGNRSVVASMLHHESMIPL